MTTESGSTRNILTHKILTAIDQNTGLTRLTWDRFRRLGRESLWIGTGQVGMVLGMLVGLRLLTGVLSPESYGELALATTLATLISQTVMGPVGNSASRFFAAARETNELGPYLTALRRLLIWTTGCLLILAAITCSILLLTGRHSKLFLGLVTVGFALISGYNSVLDGIQNAARQRVIVAWHQAIASWGRFLAAVGMVLWIATSSEAAMSGYLLAALLVLFSQFWFFRQTLAPAETLSRRETPASRRWAAQMLSYAWPFSTWGVFTWAQLASDRWFLQIFTSTREVGLYAVLYQLGYYPISILSIVVVQLVVPVFFQRAGDARDSSRMWRICNLNSKLTFGVLIFTGFAVSVAAATHRLIFTWLVAPEYQSVSWLLPIMVLSGGLSATGQFAVISLLVETESHSLIAPKIATAILGVGLNMAAAAWMGVTGVVGAGVVASAGYMVWVFYLVKKKQNLRLRECHAN